MLKQGISDQVGWNSLTNGLAVWGEGAAVLLRGTDVVFLRKPTIDFR